MREPSVEGGTQRFRPKRRCSGLQTRARALVCVCVCMGKGGGVSGKGTLHVSRFLEGLLTRLPFLQGG